MTHPRNAGYQPGNNWSICDRCGVEYRRAELHKTWNNYWVCRKCWEPRHPQEFVRGRKEDISAKEPVRVPEEFTVTGSITSTPNCAIPNIAVPNITIPCPVLSTFNENTL